MAKKQPKILEIVRQRLASEVEAGRTVTSIGKQAAISRPQLSRFLHQDRELSVDELSRLADALEMTITADQDETCDEANPPLLPSAAPEGDPLQRLLRLCQQFDEDESLLFITLIQSREKPPTIDQLASQLKWDRRHAKAVAKLIDLRLQTHFQPSNNR